MAVPLLRDLTLTSASIHLITVLGFHVDFYFYLYFIFIFLRQSLTLVTEGGVQWHDHCNLCLLGSGDSHASAS